MLDFLREQKDKLQIEQDKKEQEMKKYTLKVVKAANRSMSVK